MDLAEVFLYPGFSMSDAVPGTLVYSPAGCAGVHVALQYILVQRTRRTWAWGISAHPVRSKGDIPDFTGNRLHKILWRTGLYCYVLMYSLPLRQCVLSRLQTECFVTVFLFKAVVCLVQILEILLLWCDYVIIINHSEYIFTDKQYFFRYVLI